MFVEQNDLVGYRHWKETTWFEKVTKFITEDLGIEGTNEKDVARAVLLLYPAFGKSSGKKGQIKNTEKYKQTKIY